MRTTTYSHTIRTSLRRRQIAAELAEQRLSRHQAEATLHARWF